MSIMIYPDTGLAVAPTIVEISPESSDTLIRRQCVWSSPRNSRQAGPQADLVNAWALSGHRASACL